MAQGAQHTREDSPRFTTRFTIDCVLPLASTQLQADGCVLENLEDGHKLISPDYLRAGDLVKVQLWLEGDDGFVDIPLAVVSMVHTPWITVGVIRVSPTDRLRLKRFTPDPRSLAHWKICSHQPASHSGIARRCPISRSGHIACRAEQPMLFKQLRLG